VSLSSLEVQYARAIQIQDTEIQRIQQEIRSTGEKGERDLESHRKYKTYLLSFALVTCEDYVRCAHNAQLIQPTTNREGGAYGHTDIRPTFARMSYIRPRSFLPVSRIHTTYGKYSQILPVCRIYGQQRFWSINRMHTGNRITSLRARQYAAQDPINIIFQIINLSQ
jgi:hypothetical protein